MSPEALLENSATSASLRDSRAFRLTPLVALYDVALATFRWSVSYKRGHQQS